MAMPDDTVQVVASTTFSAAWSKVFTTALPSFIRAVNSILESGGTDSKNFARDTQELNVYLLRIACWFTVGAPSRVQLPTKEIQLFSILSL